MLIIVTQYLMNLVPFTLALSANFFGGGGGESIKYKATMSGTSARKADNTCCSHWADPELTLLSYESEYFLPQQLTLGPTQVAEIPRYSLHGICNYNPCPSRKTWLHTNDIERCADEET
jgi:hypothetical protein